MKRIYILLSMLPVGLAAQSFTEVQTGMKTFITQQLILLILITTGRWILY
ncbi:hypothetical protein [Chryseobacterium arthrosphaerae]|nr:hypothetical protein [Chryseobacterium arthrosphaerae]